MHERDADKGERIELARRESVWIGRDGGSSAVTIPLGNIFRGNKASETIDR